MSDVPEAMGWFRSLIPLQLKITSILLFDLKVFQSLKTFIACRFQQLIHVFRIKFVSNKGGFLFDTHLTLNILASGNYLAIRRQNWFVKNVIQTILWTLVDMFHHSLEWCGLPLRGSRQVLFHDISFIITSFLRCVNQCRIYILTWIFSRHGQRNLNNGFWRFNFLLFLIFSSK